VADRSPSDGAETPPLEIETGRPVEAAVIWLHGLGADGHDFEPVVPQLAARLPRATRFVFPHAPYRPVTLNNGYVMRAWYDMTLADGAYIQNETQIQESAASIHGLIGAQQASGVSASRIVVAGFSQGGVIALVAGLTYPDRLGGIVILSAPIPHPAAIGARASRVQAGIGVFLAHGNEDPIAPVGYGRDASAALQQAGFHVVWKEFPMGHTVCTEELATIGDFLGGLLI